MLYTLPAAHRAGKAPTVLSMSGLARNTSRPTAPAIPAKANTCARCTRKRCRLQRACTRNLLAHASNRGAQAEGAPSTGCRTAQSLQKTLLPCQSPPRCACRLPSRRAAALRPASLSSCARLTAALRAAARRHGHSYSAGTVVRFRVCVLPATAGPPYLHALHGPCRHTVSNGVGQLLSATGARSLLHAASCLEHPAHQCKLRCKLKCTQSRPGSSCTATFTSTVCAEF